ncbi:MAG: TSUP family transporter [Alphaproteobacteria bacterium]
MIDITALSSSPILIGIGILAGIIESTAGGSGLIVMPTLLLLGFSAPSAMATSKLQYAFGAVTSIFRFHRAKLVQWKNLLPLIVSAGVSGAIGALALIYMHPDILGALIPLLLMAATIYFIFSPRLNDIKDKARMGRIAFSLGPIALVGFYDGFFGVGSASFYVLAMVWGLGYAAREATATTKVVDFTSSAIALFVLAAHHEVLWLPGLFLGLGQIAGAWIGSGLVIKKGAKFIRPILAIVSLALSVKLCFDYQQEIMSSWNWLISLMQ